MKSFTKLSFMLIKKNFETIKVLIQLFHNKRISLLMLNLQCIKEKERKREIINNKRFFTIMNSLKCPLNVLSQREN